MIATQKLPGNILSIRTISFIIVMSLLAAAFSAPTAEAQNIRV